MKQRVDKLFMRLMLTQPLLVVLAIWVAVLPFALWNITPLDSIMFWGAVGSALVITVLVASAQILIRRGGFTAQEVIEGMFGPKQP